MPDLDDQVRWENILRKVGAVAAGPRSGLIELRLRAAVHKRRLKRRIRNGAFGVAACAAILIWGWPAAVRPPLPEPLTNYAGFMALPYAQSDVPMEQAIVVRVRLRPNDLEALGLPAALLVGRNAIRADLLVGQDGIARAVRLPE